MAVNSGTEYCITYKYTGRSNVSASSTTMVVNKNSFTISGDVNVPIKRITRITYSHYHSSTGSRISHTLKGRFHFADGTYVDSDNQTYTFNSTVPQYTNTFSTTAVSVKQAQTWTSIETVLVSSSGSGSLYWRATSSQPMVISIYFKAAAPVYYGINNEIKMCEVYYGIDGVWQLVDPRFGADGVYG